MAGGTACGKSTVSRRIIESLQLKWVVLLSTDSFYKDLPAGTDPAEYNFDHPDAIDVAELLDTLRALRQGRNAFVPVYDFKTNARLHRNPVYGADVIIVEGLFTLHFAELRELFDMCIFVDTDADLRLGRRLRRDVKERRRTVASVLRQYERFVKPAFDTYIEPTMRFADIILPFSRENNVGIDMIIRNIRITLEDRGIAIRQNLLDAIDDADPATPPTNFVLVDTPQVRALHTIIRDRTTKRDDFIFYSQRLVRLLIEEAMSLLPMQQVTVKTPSGAGYVGMRHVKPICGVSILRAGEAMEEALLEVCRDARIGKILIQAHEESGAPLLFYSNLPKAIRASHVLLMDANVGTGSTAMMAIRVLLDHGVAESDIVFVCLIAHLSGVCHLAYVFPQIRIVATALDPKIDAHFNLRPGLGSFGDRWFGTLSRAAEGAGPSNAPATVRRHAAASRQLTSTFGSPASTDADSDDGVEDLDDADVADAISELDESLAIINQAQAVLIKDETAEVVIPIITCSLEDGEPVQLIE